MREHLEGGGLLEHLEGDADRGAAVAVHSCLRDQVDPRAGGSLDVVQNLRRKVRRGDEDSD